MTCKAIVCPIGCEQQTFFNQAQTKPLFKTKSKYNCSLCYYNHFYYQNYLVVALWFYFKSFFLLSQTSTHAQTQTFIFPSPISFNLKILVLQVAMHCQGKWWLTHRFDPISFPLFPSTTTIIVIISQIKVVKLQIQPKSHFSWLNSNCT